MAKKVKKKTASRTSGTRSLSTKKKKSVAPNGSGASRRLSPKDASVKVDAYIEQAPDFAQPILMKLRSLFHKACPNVEEDIKWGKPHFNYKGMLGGIAAFKHHVAFGFWKSAMMDDAHGLFDRGPKASMCTSKIHSLDEMPSDKVLLFYIRQAVALNESGAKPVASKKAPKKPLPVPADLKALLAKNSKARAAFDGFPPSHQREYIEWITEAKRDETRQKRLATTIGWLSEGKPRNWKYMRK